MLTKKREGRRRRGRRKLQRFRWWWKEEKEEEEGSVGKSSAGLENAERTFGIGRWAVPKTRTHLLPLLLLQSVTPSSGGIRRRRGVRFWCDSRPRDARPGGRFVTKGYAARMAAVNEIFMVFHCISGFLTHQLCSILQ